MRGAWPTISDASAGADDGTVRIWEVSTSRCLGVFNLKKKVSDAPQVDEVESDGEADDSDHEDDEEEDEQQVSDSELEATAKKVKKRKDKTVIMSVQWNPNPNTPVLAVAVYVTVLSRIRTCTDPRTRGSVVAWWS